MTVTLQPLTVAELHILADSGTPESVASRAAEGALPPPFVAARSLAQLAEGKPLAWCSTFFIVRNADRRIVGGCGFKDAPNGGRVEIGYGVSPDCRNQGIATAAVSELLRLAFASDEVEEVLAQVALTNVASIRVVQKLGFSDHGMKVDKNDELVVQWTLRKPRSRVSAEV